MGSVQIALIGFASLCIIGTVLIMEYRLKTKSGEYLWFLARAQAIWDAEGNVDRMSGWIQDNREQAN